MTVRESNFDHCSSLDMGGSMVADAFDIANCSFTNSKSVQKGGAVYNVYGGTVRDSVFVSNSATLGASLFWEPSAVLDPQLHFTCCSFDR